MNKGSCMMIAVGMLAGTLFADGANVFTKYQDWQLNAVTVSDTNALSNVRGQMDFTRPMHGPWLTNPGYDTMTVTFITRVRCGTAIEYREKGAEKFVRQWKTSYGQIDYSSDIHAFFLQGLKPGTEYEYRLVDAMCSFETPYTEIVTGREIYSFRTLDPKRDRYRAWFTADLHGAGRLSLDPNYENSGAASADLYFLLGDNVEDRFGSEPRFYITFGFMDDITRLWGTRKPTVICRGNHDMQGREFNQWAQYFPRPDARNYYTIEQGPALFVVLDPNREWNRAPAAMERFDSYMREQVEWFQRLKQTEQWKRATFRIVMSHYGTRFDENGGMLEKHFGDALNDDTPEGRIHALLGGHVHRYLRHDPNSFVLKGLRKPPRKTTVASDQYNYCQVLGAQDEALVLDVAPDRLVFTSHDWRTGDGIVDKFEILPDGTVNDLHPDVTRHDAAPAMIRSGDTVAFLGDSITQLGTEKPDGYVNLVIRALKDAGVEIKPVFAGVSGDTCLKMLARLERDVLSKKPDWVIFSDGVNDPPNGIDNPGVPLAEFKAKYTEIVDRILASGAKLVILGPTPVLEEPHVANRNQGDYAKFIRETATKRNLQFADMNGLFRRLCAQKADKNVREYTVDGTHLNAVGNAHFANEVIKTLAQSLGEGGRPTFVIDRVENLAQYQRHCPNFAAAFKFLKERGWELLTPEDGKFAIDGDRVFAFVQEMELKPWEKKLVEAHRAYIDIQMPLDGDELFGVGRLNPRAPKCNFDGPDIKFYQQGLFPVTVHPGECAIFFPPLGAHAPCCSANGAKRVRKLVVKVRAD